MVSNQNFDCVLVFSDSSGQALTSSVKSGYIRTKLSNKVDETEFVFLVSCLFIGVLNFHGGI
jgi:hypothetical protein